MKKQQTNKGRRKVLQKVGVASGVAATTAWTKPTLNSVLLPAHAQMSIAMPLNGSSSSSPFASTNSSKNQSIASRALDALVPKAEAQSGFGGTCGAFTQNGPDDYRHCIELTFDENAPSTGFMLDLTGPDVYYNICKIGKSYTYYEGVANFSGSTNGTLVGQDFTVSVGDCEFKGTVADDFQSASGTLVKNGDFSFSTGSKNNGSVAFCSSGYGAYWAVTAGGECSPGAGAAMSGGRTIELDDGSCER